MKGGTRLPINQQPSLLLGLPKDAVLLCLAKLLRTDIRHTATLSLVSVELRSRVHQALAELTDLEFTALARPSGCAPVKPLSQLGLNQLLPRMSCLRSLNLSSCFLWVDDDSCRVIAVHCCALQVLRLDFCSKVSAAGVLALGTSSILCNLQELSLKSCGDIGDGSALCGLPALTSVSFEWCHSTTTAAVLALGPRLRHLVLHGCELISDAICTVLPLVEQLNLAFVNISDAGLEAIAAGSPYLCHLTLASKQFSNLWSCGLWTEGGIEAFRHQRSEVFIEFVFC